MKFFKQSIISLCLLSIIIIYAPEFPPVQVTKVYIPPTKEELAKILNVNNLSQIDSRWPLLIEYVKNNPAAFAYVMDENLKTRNDFEGSEPTTLIPWLEEAIKIVKKEEKMKNIPLKQQKEEGTKIINKVTKDLLQNYCDTNPVLKKDAARKEIIMGNAPIQIDLYLHRHWQEDWLIQAREKMKWINLTKIIEAAKTFTDVFNEGSVDKGNKKYSVNTQWLCGARKAAESDITEMKKTNDSDLATYFTQRKEYQSYPALSDAKNMIINKIIELARKQLTDESKSEQVIADALELMKQDALTKFGECIYQEEWFGPKYTQKWVNLDTYLEESKVETTNEEGKEIGILTEKWLKGAIEVAKKDRDDEKMAQDVALREATAKIRDAIPNISDKDYADVDKAVESGLKKSWFGS